MNKKVIDGAFDKSKAFFNLPMSEKMKVRMNKHQCGYMPPNVSIHNDTFETPFTVSIDGIEGCTTGMSVYDRLKTISMCMR